MNCEICGIKANSNRCWRHKPKKPLKRTAIKKKSSKINFYSKKRAKLEAQYSKIRKEFLSRDENQRCFIAGCNAPANSIEHRKGRKGFADEWARNNNIPLLIDTRYFAPCCNNHNLELERNPELSKKYQLSKIHGGKK